MAFDRNNVFLRVTVDHLLKTGTRISWRLQPDFAIQENLIFQLQLGESGVSNADDWLDIGNPAANVISFLDTEQRDYGQTACSHYRIKATYGSQVFYSPPEGCLGRLNRHDWLKGRAMVRRERLREKLFAGAYGWLFKRRKKTELVQNTDVVDFTTQEILKSANTEGVGTDRVGGYFAPYLMQVDLAPQESYPHRDNDRGMVDDVLTQAARMVAYPEVEHGDIWASATSDIRYAIHKVRVISHLRGVPLFVGAELRAVDLADPIYELDLPPAPPLQTLGREEF